jgi:hypothetical protein
VSQASEDFEHSIKDAENLLGHFDALNTQPPPPELEVLKRAGLIMAMTAWETYVEDRLQEASRDRLDGLSDVCIAEFVAGKLDEEIKRLHNPDYIKTIQLFRDYAGVELDGSLSWNNHDQETVREKLNGYLKLRGDIVHRSPQAPCGPSQSHPVKRDELEKAINFLKNLVQVTEKALGSN